MCKCIFIHAHLSVCDDAYACICYEYMFKVIYVNAYVYTHV